ncbi:MAG TPA: sulfotransferase [Burkholderiales bacterium]|nr:sulfotransferase [Burkholderiales bacterium]
MSEGSSLAVVSTPKAASSYLGEDLVFIISPPRSGSTLLQRMIGSHSAVQTHPEPHILTPLAFQGYFYRVDKAAYNHKVAANALREFVEELPNGEDDYLDACREYCRVLYGRALPVGKRFFLDKTPNYADAILPLLPRLFPSAKYIVLTRHPLAILSSRAHTFYRGDYDLAHYTRDLLNGFVPAIARFLRDAPVPALHIKYEQLATAPEQEMKRVLDYLGLGYEENCIVFGEHRHVNKSYGDPKINLHSRPVSDSINAWISDFIGRPDRKTLCERNLASISDADLRDFGYSRELIWQPLNDVAPTIQKAKQQPLLQSFKWRMIWAIKALTMRPPLNRLLKGIAHGCEALLRNK